MTKTKTADDGELQTLALSPTTPTSPLDHGDLSCASLIHQPQKPSKSWKKHTKHDISERSLKSGNKRNVGGRMKKTEESNQPTVHDSNPIASSNVLISVQSPPKQKPTRHHQTLVQSTSVEATPKRKTERVLSAPGTAMHCVTSEQQHMKRHMPSTNFTQITVSGQNEGLSQHQKRRQSSTAGHQQKLTTISSTDKTMVNTQGSNISELGMPLLVQSPTISPVNAERMELDHLEGLSLKHDENDDVEDKGSSSSHTKTSINESISKRMKGSKKYEYCSLATDDDLLPAVTVHNTPVNPQAIKLHSLQSNITLNIKPEAIRRTADKPPYTAIPIDANAIINNKNDMYEKRYQYTSVPIREYSPDQIQTTNENVDNQIFSKHTVIDIGVPSPPKNVDKNDKPTSFLTKLLSQPNEKSNWSTVDALKFFSGNQDSHKSKEKHFGSMVALAGSNSDSSSISDTLNKDNNFSYNNKKKSSCTDGKVNKSFVPLSFATRSLNLKKQTLNSFHSSTSIGMMKRNDSSTNFSERNGIFDGEEKSRYNGSSRASLTEDIISMKDLSIDDGDDWFNAATKISENWSKVCHMEDIRNEMGQGDFSQTPVGKSGVSKLIAGRAKIDKKFDAGVPRHEDLLSKFRNTSSLHSNINANKLNLYTPETNISSNKKGCASISSNNSTNVCLPVATHTSKSNNVSSLHKILQHRGLYRPRAMKKPPAVVEPNIDDAGAVREIEAGLLHLMEEFEAGNLTAFGKDSRLREMEVIREQQEDLMKFHQDVGASQDLYQPLSTEGLQNNSEHMTTLIEKLACLSQAIDNLHDNTNSAERKRNNLKENAISSLPVEEETINSVSDSETLDEVSKISDNQLSLGSNVVVRSKTSTRLSGKKLLNVNRRSADFSAQGKLNLIRLRNDNEDVNVSKHLNENKNIILNMDYNNSSKDGNKLNVLPMVNLKNIATDGQNSYIVDAPGNLTMTTSSGSRIDEIVTKAPRHKNRLSKEKNDQCGSKSKHKKVYKTKGLRHPHDLEGGKGDCEETELQHLKRDQMQHQNVSSLPKCHLETEMSIGYSVDYKKRQRVMEGSDGVQLPPPLPSSNPPPPHKSTSGRAPPPPPPALPVRPTPPKRK